MAEDHILEFLNAMSAVGLSPSNSGEIIADDKRRRYHIVGDKPNAKNGSYQLKADFEFACGWFMSFKEGITHKWSSKAKKSYTPEERAEFKKRVDNERKRKERERKKERDEAADKAARIWAKAAKVGETGYLQRKHADLNGARIKGSLIVVPIYFDSGDSKPILSSLQFIAEDGQKKFIKGGQLEGGYFPIASKDDDKSVMVICEGFATGDSIRKATGLPVLVAFNAGNLKPVAEVMRKKYPMSRFIIAADNDQWTFINTKRPKDIEPEKVGGDDQRWIEWKQAGLLTNPGIEYARQAAVAIGGAAVIWPEIPLENSRKMTDFNDLFVTEGSEIVKDRILSAVPNVQPEGYGGGDSSSFGTGTQGVPATYGDMESSMPDLPPLEAYNEDARELIELYSAPDAPKDSNHWRTKLYCDDKGVPKAKSLGNLRLFLENDKVLSKIFCYDEFCHEKIVYHCPPWDDISKFKPRSLTNDDITFLTCELERRGVVQPMNIIARMVDAVIKNNARNPAVEYFERIKWDGVPRLDKWLTYYCGAEFDNPEYLSQIGRKWLTAAVKRVFEPGCKFDHIMIFEGAQDAGKSIMLKELATIHGTPYFDDTIRISDLGDPRTVPKLQGVLIVEIAEMAGFKKKDVDELKQAITTTSDRIVKKYQNEATSFPRQFVFAGTINPVDGYLHDPTGNRRFWPVKVGRKIDLESLRKDKEQLWAEAVVRYREGETLYLENNVRQIAVSAQQDRNIHHPWYPDIQMLCLQRNSITYKELWEALGINDKTKRTRAASDDIAKIMTTLGFERSRKRIQGERESIWKRIDDSRELNFDEGEEINVR